MKFTAVGLVAALLILCVLLVSLSPAVDVQSRPSSQDLQAARHAWGQLDLARGAVATISADNRMVTGVTALARDAAGVGRMNAALVHGELRADASIPLPLGLWLNTSVAATGSQRGFPPLEVRVGRVSFPRAGGRLLTNLVRFALRTGGAEIPPLDEVVQSFRINGDQLLATVKLPSRTGLVDQLIAARSNGVSSELVTMSFCRIAVTQKSAPVHSLPSLVRRAFAEPPLASPEEHNRAMLVALSLAVAGDRAEKLLPGGGELRKKCPFEGRPLLLQGRADLAKHWSLSAALTSALGPQAANNLGEWKELQDSLPDGSGFSFVDLAADRAGVQTALLAIAPRSAVTTAEELSRATDEYMLPGALLRAPEDLFEASFVDQFGSLDESGYREAISHIDRTLRRLKQQQER